MPLGQVPILEIDGKVYYQSKAISRLIAKRNNLYGSNDEEAFLVDATVDTIDDLKQRKIFIYFKNKKKIKNFRWNFNKKIYFLIY